MKQFTGFIAGVLIVSFISLAGSIKTWSNEVLRYSDLNSNFTHVHNAAEELVTDAKVSASAAISHAKLATPALIPKAWVSMSATCGSSPCTVTSSTNVSGVTRSGTGAYTATLSYTAANDAYLVLITPGWVAARHCVLATRTTTTFGVNCYNDAGAAADSGFEALVMDNN